MNSRASYNFAGRRVLVTGGGSGIGRAAVKQFHDANAEIIVVLDKDETLLQELTHEFPRVHPVQVDLSNWDATKKAVGLVLPIHHVVNNAGITGFGPYLKLNKSQLDLTFGVNLYAAINVVQVVAEASITSQAAKGMTVVNISSIADTRKHDGASAYSASKAALTSMTKSMALELAPRGIRVNCIRPGPVDTPLLRSCLNEKDLEQVLTRMPNKKLLDPRQLAEVILFLSSSASSGITGTSLAVDSGLEIL